MRESRGFSQERLAHDSDMAVSTYGLLERAFARGQWANPTLKSLLRVIATLNATEQELAVLLTNPTLVGPYSKPMELWESDALTADGCPRCQQARPTHEHQVDTSRPRYRDQGKNSDQ